MLARLVRNPLVIGIGAGAVLILGSATAVLAQVDPTPNATASDTATPSAPPPLAIKLRRTDNKTDDVSAGTTVPMAADVTAGGTTLTDVKVRFRADAPATATPDPNAQCDASTHVCTFDSIPADQKVTVPLTVAVNTASGTFHVRAAASADTLDQPVKDSFPLTVNNPDPNGGGTNGGGTDDGGTNGGGTNGGKTGGGKTGGHTGGTNGGSTGGTSGGGSHNTTGGSTGNVPPSGTLNPPPGTGVTPPSTAPGAVLPTVPPGQPPATAGNPRALNAGNSQSMRGKAEDPDELTFNKLASTQAAWLAALLVAFSLLLTQVRLGKTANRANPVVGLHRRLRRRVRRPRSN